MAESEQPKRMARAYNEDFGSNMNRRTFHIVVVGPLGEGKSSLINSLLFKQVCGRGIEPRRPNGASVVSQVSHNVRLGAEMGHSATLVIHDADGFTGGTANDRRVSEELKKIATPDLILVCFSFASNSGRYLPMLHGKIMEKTSSIWGESAVKKAVIVLTKCDSVSEDFVKEVVGSGQRTASAIDRATKLFWDDIAAWKQELKEDQEDNEFAKRPVCTTGLVEFTVPRPEGNPCRITPVVNKKDWHSQIWRTVAYDVSQPLGGIFKAIQEEALTNPFVKADLEGRRNSVLSTVNLEKFPTAKTAASAIVLASALAFLPTGAGIPIAIGAFAFLCYFIGSYWRSRGNGRKENVC